MRGVRGSPGEHRELVQAEEEAPVEDEGDAGRTARFLEGLPPEEALVLVSGMRRQEAEGGPGFERKPPEGMGRRGDHAAAGRKKSGDPGNRHLRHGDVFENREKENSFERCNRLERGRSRASANVPFEEISRRESVSLRLENLRVAVAADVLRQPPRQVRQATPDVEDAPAARQVQKRGLQPRRPDARRETAVKGRTRRHATGFTPSQ